MSQPTRIEHDLLGDRAVPADVYYGIHTLRALENFPISGTPISIYPDLVVALACVKQAAAIANAELGLLDDELVRVAFVVDEHRPQLTALAKRYADREPDLADLCVVRMSELFPEHDVITVDEKDFRFYRRNKREVIPLICPPR